MNVPEYPPSPTAHLTKTAPAIITGAVHSLNPFFASHRTSLLAKLSCGWPCNVLAASANDVVRTCVLGLRGDSGRVWDWDCRRWELRRRGWGRGCGDSISSMSVSDLSPATSLSTSMVSERYSELTRPDYGHFGCFQNQCSEAWVEL